MTRPAFLLLLTLALSASAARAEDATASLTRLYRLDLVISACKDADVAEADQERLDNAIDAAERASGLDEAARQKIYDDLESAAEKDPPTFCKAEMPGLATALKALPPS